MLTIYFAEDDAAIRESIIRNVKWQQHGYELIGQASDGETAYEDIQKLRPDVLLTDLRMPFVDGLQLCRMVRKEIPDTKIIILTGHGDFASAQEALNMGVTRYLLKPVTPDALVESIVEVRDIVNREKEQRINRSEFIEIIAKDYDSPVEKAQDYIRANYFNEDISLLSVAKHVSLSPAHFSTIFSRKSGKTFTEYLTQIRIEKAKDLLLHSSKRSSEIAAEVGYQDSHYFSFVFKKATGCSPREYKAGAKGEDRKL